MCGVPLSALFTSVLIRLAQALCCTRCAGFVLYLRVRRMAGRLLHLKLWRRHRTAEVTIGVGCAGRIVLLRRSVDVPCWLPLCVQLAVCISKCLLKGG